ncbi:hypothetical protein LC607_25860 [Nostoc sp. CHAB 5824]|nr:hypothetical protein [Nostoc sp. CHAB 5824]
MVTTGTAVGLMTAPDPTNITTAVGIVVLGAVLITAIVKDKKFDLKGKAKSDHLEIEGGLSLA